MTAFSPGDSILSLNTLQGHTCGNFTVLHLFHKERIDDIRKKLSTEVSTAMLLGALSFEDSLASAEVRLCQAGFAAAMQQAGKAHPIHTHSGGHSF